MNYKTVLKTRQMHLAAQRFDRYITNNLSIIENKYNDSQKAIIYYATLVNVLNDSFKIPFANRFGKLFSVFMDITK